VFTITVFNQGTVDATSVEVVDYVPSDLLYDATTAINTANGWGAGPSPVTSIGAIAIGGSSQVDIELQIDPAFMGTSIVNDAEISSATNSLGSSVRFSID